MTPESPVQECPPWSKTRRNGVLSFALALSVGIHALVISVLDSGWEGRIPEAIRRIELELVAGLRQPARAVADTATPEPSAPVDATPVPAPAEVPLESAPSPPARAETDAAVEPPAPEVAPDRADASAIARADPRSENSDGRASERLAREAALRLDYLSWLERYKVYPVSARRRGVEGMVRVRFAVDREGRLLNGELIESSGSRHLDRAALDLLERASPFPAPPSELSVDRLEMELPIEYRLVGPHRT